MNDRVTSAKIPESKPLKSLSFTKAVRLAKVVKNNFLRTLQINQLLARTQGAFLQEEQLNISKNFMAF